MGQPAASTAGSGLALRLISGFVLGPAVLLLVWYGDWPFILLIAAVAAIMLQEWLHLLYGARLAATLPAMALFAAAMALVGASLLAASQMDAGWLFAGAAGALSGLACLFAAKGARSRLWILLGLVWFGIPCAALIWLRLAGEGGWLAVLWVLFLVWGSDIGAYAAGKSIGGPKLAPRLSPKKTWAGLIGGMATAALASAGIAWVAGGHPGWASALLAALLAAWSQVGDLAESAVKRYVGAKDSGTLIPGHGGILDRVDALLFVIPVVALLAYAVEGDFLPWR